jgi:hypothetical protein
LVLLIVVDQFRADYLRRFEHLFGAGGFRRLLEHGAYFTNAHVSYGVSETAPGHATIATGRLPRQHGITANEWMREPDNTKPQPAAQDAEFPLVGIAAGDARGRSPRALLGTMLGDQMKLADRRTRVFSVSIKDRAAIFMSAKSADGVFWCDKPSGLFVSSRYYMAELPDYVRELNRQGGARRYAGHVWDAALPPAEYAGSTCAETDWSDVTPILGPTFPHRVPPAPKGDDVTFSETVFGTPFANELVLELARRIVEREQLGRGPATDLLCVSLSANDYVGHYFGPDSPEVIDITVRTDRQLAEFFAWLDQQAGLARRLVVLTADHGMSSSPHALQKFKLDAGFIDRKSLVAGLNSVVRETCPDAKPDQPYVLGMDVPRIYCDPSFDTLDQACGGELTRRCRARLLQTPGIANVFTADELAGAAPPRDDLDRWLAWRSFFPARAGHFYVKLAPGWFQHSEDAAGHSAGFRSDRHVPILFAGPGVKPGRYATPADLTDIAVTLAHVLGIEPPTDAVGCLLSDLIANESQSAAPARAQ